MKDSLPETGQPSQTGGSVRCRMSVPAGHHDAGSLRPSFAGKRPDTMMREACAPRSQENSETGLITVLI